MAGGGSGWEAWIGDLAMKSVWCLLACWLKYVDYLGLIRNIEWDLVISSTSITAKAYQK